MMDVVIASALTKSCLLSSSSSFDFVIRQAEIVKFKKDIRSCCPIQESATRRLVSLAMNNFRMRDPHFSAALKECASGLVAKKTREVVLCYEPYFNSLTNFEFMGWSFDLYFAEGACDPDCEKNQFFFG